MPVKLARLKKACQQNPGTPLFARLADYYLATGNTHRALGLCQEGCKRFPDYSNGFNVLAKCHESMGSLENARRALAKALKLDPENPAGFQRLAKIYANLGNFDFALKSLRQAYHIDPSIGDIDLQLKDLSSKVAATAKPSTTSSTFNFLEKQKKVRGGPTAGICETDKLTGFGSLFQSPSNTNAVPTTQAHYASVVSSMPTPDTSGNLMSSATNEQTSAKPTTENTKEPESVSANESAAVTRADNKEMIQTFQDITSHDNSRPASTAISKPDPPILTRTLAEIYANQGQVQQACATYRQLLSADPFNEEIERRINDLISEQ